ncbi:olfactory receptor 11A1-like [Rhinophrynus dorsalis]
MNDHNQTVVTEFIIIGFKNIHRLRQLLFTLLLLTYLVIIIGNLFIVVLVPTTNHLHTPMYFFLCSLSLSDMMITSNIIPNMLQLLWAKEGTMSIASCILQFYIFGSLTATECLLLTVMSYDRYLAICNPLRYCSVMNIQLCCYLIIFSWMIGFVPTLPVAICVSQSKFCSPNIDHFFCDLAPFLELACSDTRVIMFLAFSFSFLVTFFPFLFIILSYTSIIYRIFKIRSEKGRQKAFSTCSSHLAVVTIYYGSLIILYVMPSKKRSLDLNKLLSLLYTIVTPLLNPIIYSLKNQEINRAVKKSIKDIN